MKTFKQFYESMYTPLSSTGTDTSWEDGDIKITLNDIKKIATSVEKENPLKFKHMLIDTTRDKGRIDAANLEYEIYVVRRNGKMTKILDGQHRIVKAIRDEKFVNVRYVDLENASAEMQQMFEQSLYLSGAFIF